MRALKAGQDVAKTLGLVRRFRAENDTTPIVLMGYYNPIHTYGVDRFLADAVEVGIDGLIVVDCPPEEDSELCLPALAKGIAFIRLATPTTDERRLPAVLANTAGFVYYVSITGITGTATPDFGRVAEAVGRIRKHTDLPVVVVVGFGVKSGAHAAAIAKARTVWWSARPWSMRSTAPSTARAGRERHGRGRDLPGAGTRRGRPLRQPNGLNPSLHSAPRRRIERHGRFSMVEPMNWISEVVRPRIKTLFKRETPENLWVKCPDTGQMVFHKEVEANHWVIPGSEHHLKRSAAAPSR